MIDIRVTKELGNYDPKFLGPFTLRQSICLAIAAPICYYIYQAATPIFSSDVAGFFCFIPGAIAALFGWVRPYGMRTEQFLRSIFITSVIAPSHRKYKSSNTHEQMLEALLTADREAQLADLPKGPKGRSQRKKVKGTSKPKYKRSQLAIK